MNKSTLRARCLVSAGVVAAAFASCWTNALAAGPSRHANAAQVCNSGTGEGLGHPSNACWGVYEAALEARDYSAALEAIRVGCRHKRVDFCLFAANVRVTPESIPAARSAAERYTIRRAFENAEALVTTVEVDDAEAPLFAAQASKARRAHGQRNAGTKVRLAANAPMPARPHQR
jgi:hypothetical protein